MEVYVFMRRSQRQGEYLWPIAEMRVFEEEDSANREYDKAKASGVPEHYLAVERELLEEN